MHNLTAIWDENATEEALVRTYQYLINTGQAWRLEGSVGRTAMSLIEEGRCALGKEGFTDYYGGGVPSRTEVKEGSKGSKDYVTERGHDILEGSR